MVAHCGGGPNGLAVGPEGALYICNNGGSVWRAIDGIDQPVAGVPENYRGGSIQKLDLRTMAVTTLYQES